MNTDEHRSEKAKTALVLTHKTPVASGNTENADERGYGRFLSSSSVFIRVHLWLMFGDHAMTHHRHYGQAVGPLGFPQTDRAAGALDALLKTLPKSPEFDYRHAVVTKAPTELNPGERSDVSWISTESI